MKPLENNVLIEAILDDRSAGGVLLPDVTKEQGQTRKGKVLAVGPGKVVEQIEKVENGKTFWRVIPTTVKVGDVVWFDYYSASKVESGDPTKPNYLVAENRILALED